MKINIKKPKNFLKSLPKILAKHSFLTFLGLLFVTFIFTGIIFYQNIISAEKITEDETLKISTRFEEKTYQKVLEQWQKRKEKFEKVDSEQYLDPFQEKREASSFSTSSQQSTSTQESTSSQK